MDTINGFIEVYMEARGHKGAWEGLVYCVNREKTHAIEQSAAHAQWFEERMPYDPAYRRADVRGVTARAVDAIVETGDSGPVTPIGINLPNDQAICEVHGSKSVSLANVVEAYDRVAPGFKGSIISLQVIGPYEMEQEWGLIGGLVLLAFYGLLIWWGLRIAVQAKDRFGAILSFGVSAMLFWHVFINIGMVLGIMPVAGIPLPLFSYGVFFLVSTLTGVGILLKVSMRRYLWLGVAAIHDTLRGAAAERSTCPAVTFL